MIYELRAYDLKPGAGPAYLDLFVHVGIEAVTRHLPLAGYWLTDSGALNRLYHLWIYESLDERLAARAGLAADRPWNEDFVPKGFPYIVTQQNMLMERIEGSAALDAAEAGRKTNHANLGAGAPIFAPEMQSLTTGRPASSAPLVARWRVISGVAPGQEIALWGGADPFASAPGAERHEILRPISCSPLR